MDKALYSSFFEDSFDEYYNMNISNKSEDDFELCEYNILDAENLFQEIIEPKNKVVNLNTKEKLFTFSVEKMNCDNIVPLNLIFNNNHFDIIDDSDPSTYILNKKPKSEKDEELKSLSVIEIENIDSQDSKNDINESIQIKENKNPQKEKIIESKNIDNIIPKKIKYNNLVSEDKKNKFLVYNVFNPKGTSKDLKDIRNTINEVILEKLKEESKSRLFNVSKKDKKKIIKIKRKRKHKPDDIRKKIKARFLKALRYRMNEELKYANSEKFFDFLPQCFICAITKEKNKPILNISLKEIMSTDFFEEYKKINDDKKKLNNNMLNKKRKCPLDKEKDKNKKKKCPNKAKDENKERKCPNKAKDENKKRKYPDKVKYENNIEVMKYLKDNEDIKKIFNFDIIGNKTFSDLFNEYLNSNEFEKDIFALKNEEGEDSEYIKEYIIKAYDFIKDFSK